MALPSSTHISTHPSLQAKLSHLRSSSTSARDVNRLVHEISLILAVEALAHSTSVVVSGTDDTPLGYEYETVRLAERVSLVPILRSGLGMVDAFTTLLPDPVSVHHLGLFRDPSTLQPVEYYNNLPYHEPSPQDSSGKHLAIVLDPIIATGGTAVAAIQTLREWGVSDILVVSVLASKEGIERVKEELTTQGGKSDMLKSSAVFVGAVDDMLDQRGYIRPGVGDVGDRLFGTKGK